jgi:stage III sporulation protein AD
LGLAILTQICAEICKESGEGGIASAIELIGKIEILVLALPLINDILTVAKNLIALGH